jgi:hypothetical protein
LDGKEIKEIEAFKENMQHQKAEEIIRTGDFKWDYQFKF